MILACPLCQARYLLSASLFAAGPRQVRCARCSHGWLADVPKEIDVVAVASSPPQSPPPSSVPDDKKFPPIPVGSNVPAIYDKEANQKSAMIVLGLTGILVIVLLGWLILNRQNIAKDRPFIETLYNHIGLHIYRPGEGLLLRDVRSELIYENGIMRLTLQGNVENTTEKTQEIPDILASAIGSDGSAMQRWQIDKPAATLAPAEVVPFRSSINAPQGTVTEVNLTFIEPKDDAE